MARSVAPASPAAPPPATHEAVELRDGEAEHYGGSGVVRAVANVREIIGPAVRGVARGPGAPGRAADGTGRHTQQGPTGRQCAAVRVAGGVPRRGAERARPAVSAHRPTWPTWRSRRFRCRWSTSFRADCTPVGRSKSRTCWRCPSGANSLRRRSSGRGACITPLVSACAVRAIRRWWPTKVAGRRRWLERAGAQWVTDAIGAAGLRAGVDVCLAIDVAATHFFDARQGVRFAARAAPPQRLGHGGHAGDVARRYPLVSIEDGLAEDDWATWHVLTQRLGASTQLVGDDLFTTDVARVERGHPRAARPTRCWSR